VSNPHSKAAAAKIMKRWEAVTKGLWVLVVDYKGKVIAMDQDGTAADVSVLRNACRSGLRPLWTAIQNVHLDNELGGPQGNICENPHCPLAKKGKQCIQFLPVVGGVPT